MQQFAPHFLLAYHQWCEQHHEDTYLLVSVDDALVVPPQFAEQDTIVFNISSEATDQLTIDEAGVRFNARFSGTKYVLDIPFDHILAVYMNGLPESGYLFQTVLLEEQAFYLTTPINQTPALPPEPDDAPETMTKTPTVRKKKSDAVKKKTTQAKGRHLRRIK